MRLLFPWTIRDGAPIVKTMGAHYDITVLGGGLVGTAMALAMEKHGLSVALVDRMAAEVRADPAFDGRAYAIAPGSANLLRVLGLWDGLAPNAQQVRRITVTDRANGPVPPAFLHFNPSEIERPVLGWILEDRWLRQALLKALQTSGVAHLAPTDVTGTKFGTGPATVELSDRDPLRANLVVACDGRRSAIAQSAGIRYLTWQYGQTGMVSAIAHEGAHHGVAFQSFFPGGPLAMLPLPGNRSGLVWSDRTEIAEQIAAADDKTYLVEIQARIGGRLGDISLAGGRWSYPLDLAIAADFIRPRFAVAGDAAHGVHPIAGQGLNLGLRDVAAMTEVVVQAARRGEDIGAIDVLSRYQQWRRFDATSMALGMDGLNRLFSTSNAAAQAVRNTGLGLVGRIGAARRLFTGLASGTDGDAPKMLAGQQL